MDSVILAIVSPKGREPDSSPSAGVVLIFVGSNVDDEELMVGVMPCALPDVPLNCPWPGFRVCTSSPNTTYFGIVEETVIRR